MNVRLRAIAAAAGLALALGGVGDAPATKSPEALAYAAGDRFLDRHVAADGRVVRYDQGGDTVSEGQAYALLIAVGIGDEDRFRQVWAWTRDHLQRADGLLAWRWADGAVADPSPAADADLLAAAALAMGGRAFGDPALTSAARRMSSAVLDHESVRTAAGRVLVAGPWARDPLVLNPSYLVAPAMSQLWSVTYDRRWAEVAATSRQVLAELGDRPTGLVPDWATIESGTPSVATSPSGQSPRWGWEAGRVPVQMAVDCTADGQAVAAAAWPFLRGEASGTVEAVYELNGDALVEYSHPLVLTAAAGSAAAAGEHDVARRLLVRAEELDLASPTYYGGAWVALARLWLETDLLGGCRPGVPTR